MTASAIYLPAAASILPSPRKPQWVAVLSGSGVSSAPPNINPRGFVLRPGASFNAGGANALAVGDRISIEYTNNAGAVAGIPLGARRVWRGIVHANSNYTAGANGGDYNLFMTLDSDGDALPNAVIEHGAARAADAWRIYKPSGLIAPVLNQWYLYNLDDTEEVGGNLTDGRLTTRRGLHRLALLRANSGAAAQYTAHLAAVRTGGAALSVGELDNRFGGGVTVGNSAKTAYGTGGENAILSYIGNRQAQPAAAYAPLFAAGLMSLQGFEVVAAGDAFGAMLFMADKVGFITDYQQGFSPPLWRNYKQQTAVSESGALVARYTIPQPADMDIPLRFIGVSDAIGGIADLVRRVQGNNFLYAYLDNADVPVFYGWANSITQPQFDAPTLMSGKIMARGYYRYD